MNRLREEGAEPLLQAHALLQGVEPWDAANLEAGLVGLMEAGGLKPDELYRPIRLALTGDAEPAGIIETLEGLGREETLTRLESALQSER